MRKTQASSELLQKQRYCLSTGQISCCSGATGPTGPAGPPGTGICYGPVFTGHVSQTSTAPTGVGVTGAYGFQAEGTNLLKSNGTSWVHQTTPTTYYFMDSTAGTHPMYRVNDGDTRPTEVANCDLIFDTNEGTLYTREIATGWHASISLIGPTGPAPSGASATTSTFTIPNSGSDTILKSTFITPAISPSAVQVSATLKLDSASVSGEGVVYAVVNSVSGVEFPYTSNIDRPTTVSFTQMFTGITGTVPTPVSIYGRTTNLTTTTGTVVTSIIYNLT